MAWGGLGIPVPLSQEQAKALQSGLPVEYLPKDFDMNLAKCLHMLDMLFKQCLEKHGYDASKHFSTPFSLLLPNIPKLLYFSFRPN